MSDQDIYGAIQELSEVRAALQELIAMLERGQLTMEQIRQIRAEVVRHVETSLSSDDQVIHKSLR